MQRVCAHRANFNEGRHLRRSLTASVLGAALLAVSLTGLALAGGTLVSASHNSKLRASILVNAQGRTLYVLSPESTHHLLCTSSSCLAVWPALTVSSSSTKLTLGAGAHGKLGLLRRGSHTLQVTLNGLPLYLYAGDSSRGEANGEGVATFGGTWHAVLASGRPR
jgi:predicted lipoprotein with Yx(FWY)xxD motif